MRDVDATRAARVARALVAVAVLTIGTAVAIAAPAAAADPDARLGPGQSLGAAQSLVAPDGVQRLVLRPDGVLALLGVGDDPRWVADGGAPGDELRVAADGDVVLVAADGSLLWHTGTAGHRGAALVLRDDGDLVVRGAGGATLWDAQTTVTPSTLAAGHELRPGDALASADGRHTLVVGDASIELLGPDGTSRWSAPIATPGSRLVLRADGDLIVVGDDRATPWRTGTRGHPGAVLTVQDDGDLVLRGGDGAVLWTSGTALGPAVLAAGQAVAGAPGLASPDGHLVLRAAAGSMTLAYDGSTVWSHPVPLPAGGAFVVRDDDGLALVAPDGSTSWSTDVAAGPGAALTLDSSAAVLRSATGQTLWHQDVPAETLAAARAASRVVATVGADCAKVDAPVDVSATALSSAGVRVHTCLVAAVDAMVAAAAGDGVVLRASSGWRSADQQAALRAAHCTPAPDGQGEVCSPPTAPVGSSMHERGLALDLTQGGRALTRGSTGFAWLTAHAAEYGLHNLPSEPWHWSTSGS